MQFPWEHSELAMSPKEFELLVKDWIQRLGKGLKSLDVRHDQKLEAHDGTYQIDVLAKFEALDADFVVLIECKRHQSAIPRADVQLLYAKVQSLGAHKGMLFATTGFQSGAIEYAKQHGITLVKITEGKASYETRSIGPDREPPPWADIPRYFGWVIEESDRSSIKVSCLDFRDTSLAMVLERAH